MFWMKSFNVGNGKIIEKLEALFHGAGWNVIKVIWGSDCGPVVDGRYRCRGRAGAALRTIDDQPAERLMLPLSLFHEHRVVNGADAARFIDRFEQVLSD